MGFFQMDKKAWPQIEVKMNRECPKALDLWWHLAPLTNMLGIVEASQRALMEMMHVKSRTTVHRAIKYLNDNHLVMIGKIGNQNVYILDQNLINQTHKKHSVKVLANVGIVFPSNIVLTKSENRNVYDEFKYLIKNHKTGKVNLNDIRFSDLSHGNKKKDGKKIKHHNKYTKNRRKPNDNKKNIMRTYPTVKRAKAHQGSYQLSMLKNKENMKKRTTNQ